MKIKYNFFFTNNCSFCYNYDKEWGCIFMKKWLVIVPALYIAYVLYTRKKEKCSIRTGKKKEEAK